ncbi:MAG: FAD-binding oxidoreductase [Ignavibacteria bacterium]|nr:FAD-binding oxidoreductase [Ignavibacteria bacterium]
MIVKKDFELIQNYLSDASNYKSTNCDALYIPETYDELIELVEWANQNKIPLTISGAGTGLVGGRVPLEGVIVSLEKFNKILELNQEQKTLRVQCFVTLNEIQNFLREYNLFYPPDPTEKNCSIGGTIATNASGARTLKYGSTRKWINSLKILLPNGEMFELKRDEIFAEGLSFNFQTNSGKIYSFKLPDFQMPKVKNAAGYFIHPDMDLIDLFIGSEGTLGIILEAELKVIEQPKDLLSLVIFFENFDNLYDFVSISRDKNKGKEYSLINPRALEFFDNKALEFLASKFNKVANKKFALWFEQEIYNSSFNDLKDKIIEQLFELISKCNGNVDEIWFAFNEKDVNEIKDFRHSISALVNEYISKNDLKKVGTDIAVPSNYFKEFYRYCCAKCEEKLINYVGYGHIGNDHLHFNMLPSDKMQNELAQKLYRDFCIKAIEMGGTISAEHGIGKLKRAYFELMYTENVLNDMFKIKKYFDPNLILNRGNIFPDRFYDV